MWVFDVEVSVVANEFTMTAPATMGKFKII